MGKNEKRGSEQETQSQGEYSFMKEVIKKKPIDKKAVLMKVLVLAGAAVLFGCIAAITFANMLPIVQEKVEEKQEPPAVDIPMDEDNLQEEEAVSQEGSEPAVEEAQALPIGLADYQNIYSEMLDVAEEPKMSLVTVIGITSDVDWFNKTYENQEQTTGLIVANNGQEVFVLTEYRIVENVDRIMVTFVDGVSVDARYQKHDTNTGLTILKVPLSDISEDTQNHIQVANLGNSYGTKQGEPIIALGSPMGYGDSIAFGFVTSVTNQISMIDVQYNLLTTDIIGTDEGSGVLVNLDGEVVGVIAQKQNLESNKNIIAAISISQIKGLIETLSNNKEIVYLGIKGQEITDEIAQKTGMPKGVWVDSVDNDSPAMKAGIQNSDIVVKIADAEISNITQYHAELVRHHSQEVVSVTVMRKGTEGYVEISIDVTLGAL